MSLILLILLPALGGLIAWLLEGRSRLAVRVVALLAPAAQLLLTLVLWGHSWGRLAGLRPGQWLYSFEAPWIPWLGIRVSLAMDGLSLLLVALTGFLGVLSVLASWRAIQTRIGFFHCNLLWTLAGITGIFLAMDLFLFYVFWEVILIPLFFLIDIWGHERRHAAAMKFFLVTQAGGLFLLLGIIGLVLAHGAATNSYTFDYAALQHTALPPGLGVWLMLAFFLAFVVKLPAVPLHIWLPDAHSQAPVAGNVDLAGLVLKVGAYGLLRFTVPLFPEASLAFAPVAMTLGVLGILYGALLAFAQTDLKRVIAYTSISHMGFVLLGIYSWNEVALQGVVMLLLAHGVSTGALFVLAGTINERLGTRDVRQMGGLFAAWPWVGGVGVVLAMALLGLPGLLNFVGEFLVLLGTFRVSPLFGTLGAVGLIVSVIYAVWLLQQVFWGAPRPREARPDLGGRELAMLVPSVLLLLWFGVAPQLLLTTAAPAVRGLLRLTAPVDSAAVEGGALP
jgi:NADH-quinone oxidoreductase subunit M